MEVRVLVRVALISLKAHYGLTLHFKLPTVGYAVLEIVVVDRIIQYYLFRLLLVSLNHCIH